MIPGTMPNNSVVLTYESFASIFNEEDKQFVLVKDFGGHEEGSGYGKVWCHEKVFQDTVTSKLYKLDGVLLLWHKNGYNQNKFYMNEIKEKLATTYVSV